MGSFHGAAVSATEPTKDSMVEEEEEEEEGVECWSVR